jgi:hypothetical protein
VIQDKIKAEPLLAKNVMLIAVEQELNNLYHELAKLSLIAPDRRYSASLKIFQNQVQANFVELKANLESAQQSLHTFDSDNKSRSEQ